MILVPLIDLKFLNELAAGGVGKPAAPHPRLNRTSATRIDENQPDDAARRSVTLLKTADDAVIGMTLSRNRS